MKLPKAARRWLVAALMILPLAGCGGGDEGVKTQTPPSFEPPPSAGPGSLGGAPPPVTLPNQNAGS